MHLQSRTGNIETLTIGEDRTKTLDDLPRDADTAMCREGRGSGYSVFDPVMYEKAIDRLRAW